MKPYEVEILVGEVDGDDSGIALYHVLFDGSVNDEHGFVAIGGHAEDLTDVLKDRYADGWDLATAIKHGRRGPGLTRRPHDRARGRSRPACSTAPARSAGSSAASTTTRSPRSCGELTQIRGSPSLCGAVQRPGRRLRAMDRRIFGLENEYGVTCTFRGQRRLSPDEVARYLFRRVVHWGRSSNVFLENGARLYLDVGSHPEYATPECDEIKELVAHDKAGERILEALLGAAEMRLHEEGHLRRGLPVQEQHRLGRQLLRVPRELPRRPTRRVRAHGRRPDPVLRDAADLVRRRQGAARAARRAVLHQPARRAHLGRASRAPRPARARSSTRATNRTPTRSASAGST